MTSVGPEADIDVLATNRCKAVGYSELRSVSFRRGPHYDTFIRRSNASRESPSALCIVDRPRLGIHIRGLMDVQPIQRFVAFATKCADPRNASGFDLVQTPAISQSPSSDLTRTIRGSEGIPFVTTSSLLGPDSCFAGTSK